LFRFGGQCREARVRTLFLLLLVAAAGCRELPRSDSSALASEDVAFQALADEFITGYLAWRPQQGTSLGLHEYDGRMTDLSRASWERELERLKQFDRRLDGIRYGRLSERGRYDFRLLRAGLRRELLKLDERKV
jgi:uncharacterized protein (DUF885 family)